MEYNPNRYLQDNAILERNRPAAIRPGMQRESSRGAPTRNDANIFTAVPDTYSRNLTGGSGLSAAYGRSLPGKVFEYSSNTMPPILSNKTEAYNYPAATYQNKPTEDILTRDNARKNALQSPQIKSEKGGVSIERNPYREKGFSDYLQLAGGASISIIDRGSSPNNPPGSRPGIDARFKAIEKQIRPMGLTATVKREYSDYLSSGKSGPLALPDDSPYKATRTLGESASSNYSNMRLADRLRGGSSMMSEYNYSSMYDKDFDDGAKYNYSIVEKPARDSIPTSQAELENKGYKSSTMSSTLARPDLYFRKPQLNLSIKSQSHGASDLTTNYPPSVETRSTLAVGSRYNETPVRALDYNASNERRLTTPQTAQGSSSGQTEFSPSEPRGLIGLRNIGNTCFMNSILQSVMNAPKFFDYFLSEDYLSNVNTKNDKGIAKAFGALVKTTKSRMGPPTSSGESIHILKRKIGEANSMFSGYEQHDAQEFLKTLLEGINEDLNRVTVKQPYKELKAEPDRPLQNISEEWFDYMLARDNSIVTDLFTGQLLSKTTCNSCGFKSLAFDNIWDLSVAFVKSSFSSKCDLMKMIEQFLKEETLEDVMNCEKCKQKRKFKKVFLFWRLPKILVIHLKRFDYNKNSKKKITMSVKYPVKNLDLSEFVKESTDRSVKDAKYSLFGVVNHIGVLNGGHYTAECLNPYNRKWYTYNDSMVEESSVINEKSADAEGESPYMLFYVKNSLL